MQPEPLSRLYSNGFQTPADAPRFIDKDRDQEMAAGRGFCSSNAGFHIELGEEREGERRRVVYDSSGRDHEWSSIPGSNTSDDGARAPGNTPSFNGIPGGRQQQDVSDGSEDYEEEELELEAGGGADDRTSLAVSLVAHASAAGVEDDGFQRVSSEAAAPGGGGGGGGAPKACGSGVAKLPMFPFFNSFSGHENGGRGRGEAEGNGVSDSMFYNPLAAAPEKRLAHGQENSVRHFLSDPISGILMDDAVIFPCGHSVGNAGYLRVQETNACVVCMLPVAPGLAAPNLALRAAVQAFRRDREFPIMTSSRSAKRRREQDDDSGKVKGVQFPYCVGDRVLIKGNKRTPERFVGREAIITTQCLNGWYLVKTIDNGESVRLQYRSLQKVGE